MTVLIQDPDVICRDGRYYRFNRMALAWEEVFPEPETLAAQQEANERLKAVQDLVLMAAQAGGIPPERLASAVEKAIADSISKAMA